MNHNYISGTSTINHRTPWPWYVPLPGALPWTAPQVTSCDGRDFPALKTWNNRKVKFQWLGWEVGYPLVSSIGKPWENGGFPPDGIFMLTFQLPPKVPVTVIWGDFLGKKKLPGNWKSSRCFHSDFWGRY